MLARLRSQSDDEGGFTLIELLVVIIIIGILAAVAIPTFLKQREKGYLAAMKADTKNAITAEESWATEHNGLYYATPAGGAGDAASDLKTAQGFNASPNVVVKVTPGSPATSYKACTTSSSITSTWVTYDSSTGQVNAVNTLPTNFTC